jgi:hypothetical protein
MMRTPKMKRMKMISLTMKNMGKRVKTTQKLETDINDQVTQNSIQEQFPFIM